jgi:hypothetical protein
LRCGRCARAAAAGRRPPRVKMAVSPYWSSELERHGADWAALVDSSARRPGGLDARDSDGSTLLHAAAGHGDGRVVAALLQVLNVAATSPHPCLPPPISTLLPCPATYARVAAPIGRSHSCTGSGWYHRRHPARNRSASCPLKTFSAPWLDAEWRGSVRARLGRPHGGGHRQATGAHVGEPARHLPAPPATPCGYPQPTASCAVGVRE